MKKIKNVIAVMIMAFGLMVTAQSCRDACKDVECNNGTCDEGTCICEGGYEGTNCDVAVRSKFLGTYAFTENCNSGADQYSVTVNADGSDIQKIRIVNIYGAGLTTEATVSGTSLTIASQSFGSTNSTISGSGSVSGNNLTITYTVTATAGSDSCTGTGTK
ncbi:MAG: hypothetical protein H0X62_01865 [Bacteroidetes bacterium]|nr:hypothetical protein [Bacteroidota bacterium]